MFTSLCSLFEELKNLDTEIVIAGEVCEWQWAEYARDAGELGFKKSLIVLGHMTSERDGMKLLTDKMAMKYSNLEIKYFDCGDVYHTL